MKSEGVVRHEWKFRKHTSLKLRQNVKPYLCLIKHHGMKIHKGVALDEVVSFMPQPPALSMRKESLVPTG
jgi:hypothetical protein